MKKTLFLTALVGVLMIACQSNDELKVVDESSVSSKIEVLNYRYDGINYTMKFDVSDEGNPILLENKDNDILSKLYKDHNQLVTVYVNDSTYYLYDNMQNYEKSTLYVENENRAAAFKKNMKIKKKSSDNLVSASISPTLPDYGTNLDSEAYFYRRGNKKFSGGGYYVNLSSNFFNSLYIPDFRYLSNSAASYGGLGGSLFPLSAYNTGSANHNDAISSLYVNLMKVVIYEHQNYSGHATLLDARGGPTHRISEKDLNKLKYSCGFMCFENWNDRISSISCFY